MMPDFIGALPTWGCVLVAFVPPILIAALLFRVSKRIDRSNDNVMTSVGRLVGAALVFISAFTIATVWQQTNSYLNSVSAEYTAASSLVRAAAVTDEAAGARIRAATDAYLEAANDAEFGYRVPLREDGPAEVSFEELAAQVAAEARTYPEAAAKLDDALTRMVIARDTRLNGSNQPGVPGVVALTVMLLAWITVAVLTLYPGGDQPRVKVFQVVTVVVVVGLIQLPVLYLSSRGASRELVEVILSR